MIRQVQFCDWCKKRRPVVVVIAGDEIGMVLCSKCQEEFIDGLKDIYFDDIEPQYFDADNDKKEQEGSGDWRMAKKNEQPDRSA